MTPDPKDPPFEPEEPVVPPAEGSINEPHAPSYNAVRGGSINEPTAAPDPPWQPGEGPPDWAPPDGPPAIPADAAPEATDDPDEIEDEIEQEIEDGDIAKPAGKSRRGGRKHK